MLGSCAWNISHRSISTSRQARSKDRWKKHKYWHSMKLNFDPERRQTLCTTPWLVWQTSSRTHRRKHDQRRGKTKTPYEDAGWWLPLLCHSCQRERLESSVQNVSLISTSPSPRGKFGPHTRTVQRYSRNKKHNHPWTAQHCSSVLSLKPNSRQAGPFKPHPVHTWLFLP